MKTLLLALCLAPLTAAASGLDQTSVRFINATGNSADEARWNLERECREMFAFNGHGQSRNYYVNVRATHAGDEESYAATATCMFREYNY